MAPAHPSSTTSRHWQCQWWNKAERRNDDEYIHARIAHDSTPCHVLKASLSVITWMEMIEYRGLQLLLCTDIRGSLVGYNINDVRKKNPMNVKKEKPHMKIIRAHDSAINMIKSLHSSESSFITVSDDQKIKIWRMEWKDDGSSPFPVLQQTLHYHTSYVLSCDVNHDGNLIVSCGLDGEILIWAYGRNQPIYKFQVGSSCSRVYFHPADTALIYTYQNAEQDITLWDLKIDPSYTFFYRAAIHCTVNETHEGIQEFFRHNPDTLRNDDHRHRPKGHPLLCSFNYQQTYAFSPILAFHLKEDPSGDNPQQDLSSSKTAFSTFDNKTRQYVRNFRPHEKDADIRNVLMTQDGMKMLSQSSCDLKIWDVLDKERHVSIELKTLDVSPSCMISSMCLVNPPFLYIGHEQGEIAIWDMGYPIAPKWKFHSHHRHPIVAMTTSSDNAIVATADKFGHVHVRHLYGRAPA